MTNMQLNDTIFTMPMRVYYEDTDFSGIVYHANYLKFAERARSEFLRHLTINHKDLLTHEPPLAFAVRAMEIKFNAPAHIDDHLHVYTQFTYMRGARLKATQWIMRDAQDLWRAQIDIACITLAGKPARLPAYITDILQNYIPA